MVGMLTRNWGWVAVRGVAAILFGLLTFFNPGITIAVLVFWFGAYAFVDGMFMVVSAIANRHGQSRWGALLAGGLMAMAAGVLTFLMPGITTMALLMLIGAWAIVTGIAEMVAAIRLRQEITGEWMFVLAGALAVAFGVVMLVAPGAGALAAVLWLGVYTLISGILLVSLSFRLRSWGRMHPAM